MTIHLSDFFLAFLIKNNIVKFDKTALEYDLIDFYKDENFKELFEDLSIKEQINTNYIDLSEQEKVKRSNKNYGMYN